VDERRGAGIAAPVKTPQLDYYVASFTRRPTRHFLTYDPRPALRRTTVPVLVLYGDLDLLVPADQNLPEVTRALREGGNREVTAQRLAGITHPFQRGKTGRPEEYGQIEETIDPAVLDVITNWTAARRARH
jgi:pimeloyl-ACP methyl ester carboxylesterase